jgi:hypothetical protein
LLKALRLDSDRKWLIVDLYLQIKISVSSSGKPTKQFRQTFPFSAPVQLPSGKLAYYFSATIPVFGAYDCTIRVGCISQLEDMFDAEVMVPYHQIMDQALSVGLSTRRDIAG